MKITKRINMNNFKKIGLSALAGSLVAFSANAAEISVSGGVELTYTDTGGNKGNEVTGNSFGANSGLTFAGSGDVGFGTVSMTRAINDSNTGWGSSFQTLDMGSVGVFSFDSTGGALVGSTANDDLLPTAYEEMWTGVSGSGVKGVGSTNVIGYRNTFGDISVSAGYTNGKGSAALGESTNSGETGAAHGSVTDISVTVAAMEGLTLNVGYAEDTSTAKTTTSEDTVSLNGQAVYSMGPVSAGYRMTEVNNGGAGTTSRSIDAWSVAFNVNENFAISYGEQDTEVEAIAATAAVTETVKGINAAYTMGAASVRLMQSKSDDDNGVKGTDDEVTEISLVLSF
jgi:outer membrane protein OmpU